MTRDELWKGLRSAGRFLAVASLAGGLTLYGSPAGSDRAWSQEADDVMELGVPTGHIPLENPADLEAARAEATYQAILGKMRLGYASSGDRVAKNFGDWRRFNSAPYRSAQHGNRFVNNYGNRFATAYGRFEQSGTLPQGSVLAKDSFTVTADGQVYAGALFLMEKMAPGFNPASLDWRYTMILPDGAFFGQTNGEGSNDVAYCIACHELAGAEQDHLFYIPDPYRK